MRHLLAFSRGDHGAVLVMFALWLPVLVLAATLAIDVSNWFVHKRHLQMQADAAALAGAGDFRLPNCTTAPIVSSTEQYSGIDPALLSGPGYNAQIGTTLPRNVHLAINSDSFLGSGDPEAVVVGDPCTQMYIDTKLTESNLPWLLRAAKVVPAIHAHARVSILQESTTSAALPIAVPDVKPKRVRVTFIDENTGSDLGHADLNPDGSSGADAVWDNVLAPVPVTINHPNIGMRVAISGSTTNIACGDQLVQCYDAGSGNGVLYVRGWSQDDGGGKTPSQAGGNPPLLQDVNLVPGTCNDAYFTNTSPCTVGVRARVNWGTDGPNPTGIGGQVTVTMGGRTDTLTYNTATGWWESPTDLPVGAQVGPVTATMAWAETKGTYKGNTCKTGNGNKCVGNFNPDSSGNAQPVQRSFAASADRSGPIDVAKLSNDGGTTFGTDSFEECSSKKASCTQNLTVVLGLKGALGLAQPGDPPVSLRVVGGSQNQSLNCDPALSNLKTELAQGCSPQYTKNTGGVNCSSIGSTLSALSGTPQPWQCVAVSTGTSRNDPAAGLNQRILCSTALGDQANCPSFGKATACTEPNHWANYGTSAWNPNDPRIVQVYITPFGTFNGSGNELVPVIDFATFYITGWTGQGSGFNNPCQGNGDDPVPNNDTGVIVGHFITYIDNTGSSTGTTPCDPLSLTPCVAQLTQ